MGQFSFLTQDTGTSVSSMKPANVYLTSPSGQVWHETSYKGYGVFGGKDIYELLSELNGGKSCRDEGIGMAYEGADGTEYPFGDNPNIVWPNLTRRKKPYDVRRGPVKGCPEQGWT